MSIWDKGVSGNPHKRQLGRETRTHWQLMLAGEQKVIWAPGGEACKPSLWGAEQSKHTLLLVNMVQRTPWHKGASLLEGALISPSGDMAHGVSVPRYSYGVLSAPTVSCELTEAQACAAFSYAQKGLTTNGLNHHRSQSTPPHNNTRHFSLTHTGKMDVVLVNACYFSEGKLINGSKHLHQETKRRTKQF